MTEENQTALKQEKDIQDNEAQAEENKTYDILQYLEKEKRGLDEAPFNEIDALVFSVLSYCRFDDLVPSPDDRGEWVRLDSLLDENTLTEMTYGLSSREKKRELIEKTALNPRFGGLRVNYYTRSTDDLMEKQFSAVSFRLPDNTIFLAYRGTDNSLTGWRENFNMAYLDTVPAQHSAAEYYRRVAEMSLSALPWKNVDGFRLGGHSKGGNLAMYTAMNSPAGLRSQMLDAYSFDGPGFKKNIFENPEYMELRSRIHLLLPQDSMIGTLLVQSADYEVVRSTAVGFNQHDPFSWRVEGDSFINEADLTPKAKLMNDVLDQWMDGVEDSKRWLLIRTVFEIIDSTDARTFGEVLAMISRHEWGALRTLKNVRGEDRRDLISMLMSLVRTYRRLSKERKDSADGQ